MLDATKAAQALHYTEWGLEREKMPYGGERCWPSNWVPSIWSVREMWPGDNYHLALAYFQTGLADDGWNILRGTFPHMAFYGPVPGDLGYPCGATDFNDCASMFCRVVVEGLFGYRPDYPNRRRHHRAAVSERLGSRRHQDAGFLADLPAGAVRSRAHQTGNAPFPLAGARNENQTRARQRPARQVPAGTVLRLRRAVCGGADLYEGGSRIGHRMASHRQPAGDREDR